MQRRPSSLFPPSLPHRRQLPTTAKTLRLWTRERPQKGSLKSLLSRLPSLCSPLPLSQGLPSVVIRLFFPERCETPEGRSAAPAEQAAELQKTAALQEAPIQLSELPNTVEERESSERRSVAYAAEQEQPVASLEAFSQPTDQLSAQEGRETPEGQSEAPPEQAAEPPQSASEVQDFLELLLETPPPPADPPHAAVQQGGEGSVQRRARS